MDPNDDIIDNLVRATLQTSEESATAMSQPTTIWTDDEPKGTWISGISPSESTSLSLGDPLQIFPIQQGQHLIEHDKNPAAIALNLVESGDALHVYTMQEAEESLGNQDSSSLPHGIHLAAPPVTCERMSSLDHRAEIDYAKQQDASYQQAEAESDSSFEDDALGTSLTSRKRAQHSTHTSDDAAPRKVSARRGSISAQPARRVAPSHTSREPHPQDFQSQADFLRAWQQWRMVRDANNESVRKSRTSKRGKHAQCDNQTCSTVYDRLLLLEHTNDLLLKTLRGMAPLTPAERARLDALLANNANLELSKRVTPLEAPAAKRRSFPKLMVNITVPFAANKSAQRSDQFDALRAGTYNLINSSASGVECGQSPALPPDYFSAPALGMLGPFDAPGHQSANSQQHCMGLPATSLAQPSSVASHPNVPFARLVSPATKQGLGASAQATDQFANGLPLDIRGDYVSGIPGWPGWQSPQPSPAWQAGLSGPPKMLEDGASSVFDYSARGARGHNARSSRPCLIAPKGTPLSCRASLPPPPPPAASPYTLASTPPVSPALFSTIAFSPSQLFSQSLSAHSPQPTLPFATPTPFNYLPSPEPDSHRAAEELFTLHTTNASTSTQTSAHGVLGASPGSVNASTSLQAHQPRQQETTGGGCEFGEQAGPVSQQAFRLH